MQAKLLRDFNWVLKASIVEQFLIVYLKPGNECWKYTIANVVLHHGVSLDISNNLSEIVP